MDVRPESPSSSSPERSGRPSSFEVRGAVAAPAPVAEGLRVLLATSPQGGDELSASLERLGHAVVAAGSAAEAAARAAALRPDVVLLDVALLDAAAGASADDVGADAPGVPIVLYCGHPDVRLSDREVGASAGIVYLPTPVPPGFLNAALRLAVHHGRELEAARQEAAEARQQLEDRKLVERAKGVLMRRTGASEQDAYSMLRRQSQDRSMRMVDVARQVLASEPGRRAG